jgi:hypothetical protein
MEALQEQISASKADANIFRAHLKVDDMKELYDRGECQFGILSCLRCDCTHANFEPVELNFLSKFFRT